MRSDEEQDGGEISFISNLKICCPNLNFVRGNISLKQDHAYWLLVCAHDPVSVFWQDAFCMVKHLAHTRNCSLSIPLSPFERNLLRFLRRDEIFQRTSFPRRRQLAGPTLRFFGTIPRYTSDSLSRIAIQT